MTITITHFLNSNPETPNDPFVYMGHFGEAPEGGGALRFITNESTYSIILPEWVTPEQAQAVIAEHGGY